MMEFDDAITQIKLGAGHTQLLTVHMLQRVSEQTLLQEGFRNWDGRLMLMPPWALDHMQPGETLTCIDGTQAQVGLDEIDTDTRGGCLAYGFLKLKLYTDEEKLT